MLEYRVMSSIYLQTVGLTVKISILVIKLVFFEQITIRYVTNIDLCC